jgi:hypothetical protein
MYKINMSLRPGDACVANIYTLEKLEIFKKSSSDLLDGIKQIFVKIVFV